MVRKAVRLRNFSTDLIWSDAVCRGSEEKGRVVSLSVAGREKMDI